MGGRGGKEGPTVVKRSRSASALLANNTVVLFYDWYNIFFNKLECKLFYLHIHSEPRGCAIRAGSIGSDVTGS